MVAAAVVLADDSAGVRAWLRAQLGTVAGVRIGAEAVEQAGAIGDTLGYKRRLLVADMTQSIEMVTLRARGLRSLRGGASASHHPASYRHGRSNSGIHA